MSNTYARRRDRDWSHGSRREREERESFVFEANGSGGIVVEKRERERGEQVGQTLMEI